MPITSSEKGEREGIMQVSRLMLVSARTAPKSGGVDDILTALVSGKEKELLAKEMEKIAQERGISGLNETPGTRGTLKPLCS